MGIQSITGVTSLPGVKITLFDHGEWIEERWEPDDEPPVDAEPNANTGTVSAGSDTGVPGDNAAWPVMDAAAYHGLAGEVVHTLLPHTESDPVALLLQYLASFGNMAGRVNFSSAAGRAPHVRRANANHYTNIFVFIVGRTSRSRKGTSAQDIRTVMEATDYEWTRNSVKSGISSGEGIIEMVCDARFEMNRKTGELVCVAEAVDDKRLYLDEREFSSALNKMKQDTNIVSRILREAWDCIPPILATRTKHQPSTATEPLISVIGHITLDEIRQKFDDLSITDGFGNRFLYACTDRSKLLPEGGEFDPAVILALGAKTRDVVITAQGRGLMTVADDARPRWVEFYNAIEAPSPNHNGLLGHLTARAAPQALRLSLLYALLDGAPQIMQPHVEAAIAVWQFCEDSARYIFATRTSDHAADEIIAAVERARPDGISRTSLLHDTFGRNIKAHELTRALKKLEAAGKIRCEINSRRKTETWFAT
jgi:hypothetical protein